MPFPLDDALYGRVPRQDESYGVRLGTVAVRGERGSLVVGVETLMRAIKAALDPLDIFNPGKILPA